MTKTFRQYIELLDELFRARARVNGPLSEGEETTFTNALLACDEQLGGVESRRIGAIVEAYKRATKLGTGADPHRAGGRTLRKRYGHAVTVVRARKKTTTRAALAWLSRAGQLSIETWYGGVSPDVAAKLSIDGLTRITGGLVRITPAGVLECAAEMRCVG